MRLITKLTLVYLLTTLIVFAIGGVMTYYIIKGEIDSEHRRFLTRRIDRAAELIRQGANLPPYDGDKLDVIPLKAGTPESEEYVFSDTMVWHPYLKRLEPHYKVSAVKIINGNAYHLETFDVIVETDDIMETVIESLSQIYILLLLAVVLIGTLASARIFQPFNDTLNKIRDFRVGSLKPLSLRSTNTSEFARLNHFVEQMADRSQREYQALKEFSENASHEFQTPISIAKGNLDRIMESPRLKSEDIRLLDTAQQALKKLSKLGHSLSLLTRIDNEEFSNRNWIDFSKVVQRLEISFRDLAELKGLIFTSDVAPNVQVRIDPMLADILVSNLLQNAIRHNVEGGHVDIELHEDSLRIANAGPAPSTNPEEFFRRFRKGVQSSANLGLGLAIVKRICEHNNMMISYVYHENEHIIEVFFPEIHV